MQLFIADLRLGHIRCLDTLDDRPTLEMLQREAPHYQVTVPVPQGILY